MPAGAIDVGGRSTLGGDDVCGRSAALPKRVLTTTTTAAAASCRWLCTAWSVVCATDACQTTRLFIDIAVLVRWQAAASVRYLAFVATRSRRHAMTTAGRQASRPARGQSAYVSTRHERDWLRRALPGSDIPRIILNGSFVVRVGDEQYHVYTPPADRRACVAACDDVVSFNYNAPQRSDAVLRPYRLRFFIASDRSRAICTGTVPFFYYIRPSDPLFVL